MRVGALRGSITLDDHLTDSDIRVVLDDIYGVVDLLQFGRIVQVVGENVPFVDHKTKIGRALLFTHLNIFVGWWQQIHRIKVDNGFHLLLLEHGKGLFATILKILAGTTQLLHFQHSIVHPGFILDSTEIADMKILTAFLTHGKSVREFVLQFALKVDLLIAAIDEYQREFSLLLCEGIDQFRSDDDGLGHRDILDGRQLQRDHHIAVDYSHSRTVDLHHVVVLLTLYVSLILVWQCRCCNHQREPKHQ